MRVVDSRNRVSFGGILWKTTLAMDDFPDLDWVSLGSASARYRLTGEVPSEEGAVSHRDLCQQVPGWIWPGSTHW